MTSFCYVSTVRSANRNHHQQRQCGYISQSRNMLRNRFRSSNNNNNKSSINNGSVVSNKPDVNSSDTSAATTVNIRRSTSTLNDWEVIEEEDYRFKIILLGDSSVGKTSLMTQFIQKTFPLTPLTTIAFEHFKEEFFIEGNVIRVTFWDTAGMERYHSLGGKYYQGVNAVILVYDISCRQSFLNVKNWIKEMQSYNLSDEVICMLIGNKSDCDSLRQVTLYEAKQFISEYPEIYWVFETSAKDYDSFEKPLRLLVTEIAKQVGCISRSRGFSLRNGTSWKTKDDHDILRRYRIKGRSSSFSIGTPVKNWWSKWVSKC